MYGCLGDARDVLCPLFVHLAYQCCCHYRNLGNLAWSTFHVQNFMCTNFHTQVLTTKLELDKILSNIKFCLPWWPHDSTFVRSEIPLYHSCAMEEESEIRGKWPAMLFPLSSPAAGRTHTSEFLLIALLSSSVLVMSLLLKSSISLVNRLSLSLLRDMKERVNNDTTDHTL